MPPAWRSCPASSRYEEAASGREIRHAFRVTVRATNGYVWPASHRAGSSSGALPMGARLRLKASKSISGYPAYIQRIFRAMQTYGLIVADNGSTCTSAGDGQPVEQRRTQSGVPKRHRRRLRGRATRMALSAFASNSNA
jgi:hypothetical protein